MATYLRPLAVRRAALPERAPGLGVVGHRLGARPVPGTFLEAGASGRRRGAVGATIPGTAPAPGSRVRAGPGRDLPRHPPLPRRLGKPPNAVESDHQAGRPDPLAEVVSQSACHPAD